MKYLIIENLGYEGERFYSFESDKEKQELQKELAEFFGKDNDGNRFYGHNIYSGCVDMNDFEILSIEEFWKRGLPSLWRA